jgi:hypothetical protein
MEPTELYDQVWAKYRERVRSRIPDHVQRHMEKAFERQAKEPYSLPGEAAQFRQDFRRFVAGEMPPLVKLLAEDRLRQEQHAQQQVQQRKPRRRRRSPDPETRENRRSVLQFVARRGVPVASLLRGRLTVGRWMKYPYHVLADEWRRSHPHSSLTADSLKTICSDTRKDKEFTSALLSGFQAEFDRVCQGFRENPPSHDHLRWLADFFFETGPPSAVLADYQFAIHAAANAYQLTLTPDECPDARRLRAIGRHFLRTPLQHMSRPPAYPGPTVADEAPGEPVTTVVIRLPRRERDSPPVGEPGNSPPPA